MHRVALSHACGIASEAILEKLVECGVTPDSLVLLDDDSQVGKRVAFAGSRMPVQDWRETDLAQFSLLLMPVRDSELEGAALESGCLLVSHAIECDDAPLFVDPRIAEPNISYSASRLRLAGPELCCLLPVLMSLEQAYAIERINATLLRSAEFHGRAGVDELASQTVNLLNSREASASVYPQQIAFNLLPGPGQVRLGADLCEFLGNMSYSATLQIVDTPVFHGLAVGLQLAFAKELSLRDCEDRLSSLSNVIVKNGQASPIFDCNQSFSCVISQLEQAPDQLRGVNFWMIADPMRYGLATNYGNVTEFLLKSFL